MAFVALIRQINKARPILWFLMLLHIPTQAQEDLMTSSACNAWLLATEAPQFRHPNLNISHVEEETLLQDFEKIWHLRPITQDFAWLHNQWQDAFSLSKERLSNKQSFYKTAKLFINEDSSDWLDLKHAIATSAFFALPIIPDDVYRLDIYFIRTDQEVYEPQSLRFYFPLVLGLHFPTPVFTEEFSSSQPLVLIPSGFLNGLQRFEKTLNSTFAKEKLLALGFPDEPFLPQGMQGSSELETLLLGLGYIYDPLAINNYFRWAEEQERLKTMEYFLMTRYRYLLPHDANKPRELSKLAAIYLDTISQAAQKFLQVAQSGLYALVPYSWDGLTQGRPVGFLSLEDYKEHYIPHWQPPGPWWIKTRTSKGLLLPSEWVEVMKLSTPL